MLGPPGDRPLWTSYLQVVPSCPRPSGCNLGRTGGFSEVAGDGFRWGFRRRWMVATRRVGDQAERRPGFGPGPSGGPRERGRSDVGGAQWPGLRGSVSHAPNCLDQAFVFRAELGPEPPDVHVDRARPAVEVVPPDLREQLAPGEDTSRPLDEEPQDLEFLVSEVEDRSEEH